MALFAVDSSAVIAAVSDWHAHQAATRRAIDQRLDRGETMILPAHAMLEAYSVLTRLPKRHRLSAADAWTLLEANFVSIARLHALDAEAYAALLVRLVTTNVVGSRVYDEVIVQSALLAGAITLVTLNPTHFDPPLAGLAIVDPSAQR